MPNPILTPLSAITPRLIQAMHSGDFYFTLSTGATFATDNAEHFEPYLLVQLAKLGSGRLGELSMIIRHFRRSETYPHKRPDGKMIQIPMKDVAGLLLRAEGGLLLSAEAFCRLNEGEYVERPDVRIVDAASILPEVAA